MSGRSVHGRRDGRAARRGLALALLAAALLGAPRPATPADGGETPAAEPYLLDGAPARPLPVEALLERPARFGFPVGERLVYAVRYLGVPVGDVTLEVARLLRVGRHRVAHVVARADTNAFFSTLYPIHDRSEAWIDVDTLRTLQTATWVRHGRRKQTYEEVAFDRETRLVHVLEHKHHADRVREATLDTGPDVYDTFDAFYAIRALPLAVGSREALPVYAHFAVHALEVTVDRETRAHSAVLGDTPVLVLRPRNLEDAPEPRPDGEGAGEILLTADGRRVPLGLDGWFRSNEGFLVSGVSADLAAYVPGDPRLAAQPFATRPARVEPVPGDDGRPQWEPPPAVRRARARLGLEILDRKHHGTSPRTLLVCGRLQAADRFAAAPFEGAGPPLPPADPRHCPATGHARPGPARPPADAEPSAAG